ncbi:hypothetical protein CK203_050923 [Vitis vinifera]|uniref:Reverse transcriptase zinc-binding domain-containing protein n=1 Tax=Vitis vinifera TaxID=29760 RepID=A0A438GQZ2_VITVI|nr:hypothetical protein CK203_050923 [Vitis vinifera]
MVASKVRGERSKGLSSWIRFGERILSYLLEGVEAWCKGESSSRCLKVWEDGKESSGWSVDQMKLVGGKGLVGGWFLLAKKLRALGVSTPAVSKVFPDVPTSEKVGNSFKEKVKGTYANATGQCRGVHLLGGGVLPRPVSYHFPILLDGGGMRGPSHFKFEKWLVEEGFKDQVKNWWVSFNFTRTFSFVLDAKLRALNLKTWNKEVFGFIEPKKGKALDQVMYWDEKEKVSTLNLEEYSNEIERLELPYSEEEVFVALSNLGKDKALGPNGYTMAFWLFCWDVVKEEVLGFFRDFHEDGRFVKSLNATFLTLVPKKGGAEDLKWISFWFFPKFKGIETRNPLSPYLFVIAMEVFSCLLRRAISGGYLSGWRVKGLRINLEKSELIPVGRVHNIEDLALKLGCKVGGLPSNYLGLLLGAPFKSVWCNTICLERRKYRLGVRNLSLMDIALLSKWNWRYANEREPLWKQVISQSMVKRIRGGAPARKLGWRMFGTLMVMEMDGPLFSQGTLMIGSSGNSPLFPSGSIWRSSTPPKVAFFAWEASWRKVLTLDQLQRRRHFLTNRLKETLLRWHGSFVGKAHKKDDSNEPPMGLYRARKLLETPRVGRVWKVLESLEKSTQLYTMWKVSISFLSFQVVSVLASKQALGARLDLSRSTSCLPKCRTSLVND